MKGGLKKEMIFNFRKIASVISSAAMISSTVALAAAANFPAPYVTGGAGDVAVVYGANAATTDLLASVDIQSALSNQLAGQTASSSTTSGGSITGEAAALFSGGTKLYVNDSLNLIKTVLTDADLPNALVDGSFSGNVDVTFTQTIDVGATPVLEFKKQPTSSDEPAYSYTLSTSANNYIYNAFFGRDIIREDKLKERLNFYNTLDIKKYSNNYFSNNFSKIPELISSSKIRGLR